jgi:hypothetical protein
MRLSLSQTQALNELANHLYSFLPGKAHPFADQSISFQGIAANLSVSKFWPGGSKLPAICQLMSNTLQYENNKFCPLLLEVVRRGMTYRQNKGNPITRQEVENLNELIAKIGFKIPELHDPKFLTSLPGISQKTEERVAIKLTDHKVHELQTTLLKISSLSPQERGFTFQEFLTDLFEASSLAPRGSFRLIGEQIDGSFLFQDETYLMEATWRSIAVGQEELLAFSGKVAGKAEWSRGLFIGYSGFSQDGLEAFMRGKPTNIVCMDAFDLYCVLAGKLDLNNVLERKVRRAAETNQAFVPVKELFPNVPLV